MAKEFYEIMKIKLQIYMLEIYLVEKYNSEDEKEISSEEIEDKTLSLIDEYYRILQDKLSELELSYYMTPREERMQNYIFEYLKNYLEEPRMKSADKNEIIEAFEKYKSLKNIRSVSFLTPQEIEEFCALFSNRKKLLTPATLMDIVYEKELNHKNYPETVRTRDDLQREYIKKVKARILEILEHGVTNHQEYNYEKDVHKKNQHRSISSILRVSITDEIQVEEMNLMKNNSVLLKLLFLAEEEIKESIGKKIRNRVRSEQKKQIAEQKKQDEDKKIKMDIYKELITICNFLSSGLSKKEFCKNYGINPKSFDKIILRVKELNVDLYNSVMQKITKDLTDEEIKLLKILFENYSPRETEIDLIEYYSITTRTTKEAYEYLSKIGETSLAEKIRLFSRIKGDDLTYPMHRIKREELVDYEKEKKIKTIINGYLLTEEDIENIKNFIEQQGFPSIREIYLNVRDNYLKGNLDKITRENILKRLSPESDEQQKQRTIQ